MKLSSTIVLSIIAFAGLSSCNSQKVLVEKTKVEKTKIENSAMISTIGIPYFKAMGTEPFWNLEVSEKEVKFTQLGIEKGIVFPNKDLQMLEEGSKITFGSDTHMLIIDAKAGECSDDMSDERYSHKVTVTLINEMTGEATENYGCGQFFADPQLSNRWILETFRGQEVGVKDFGDEVPNLEFIGQKSMFTGFAGCNRINGKLKPNTGNRLELIDIASTKMMCGPDNREQEFINVLAKVGAYKFDGQTLILLDATYVPVATFKKK